MIVILLNWAYILVTCYCIGHAILTLFIKLLKYEGRLRSLAVLLSGFAIVTAYAGYFSIFHKVGLAANIVLIFSVIICLILERKHYLSLVVQITDIIKRIKNLSTAILILRILQLCAAAIIFFAIIFFTCYGMFHSDSGLYHAQSIRWIEEYGVIKGLALVQNRFGYNSAFFSVSALYSFAFLGQSLHGVNGFMAALVTLYAYFTITDSLFSHSFGNLNTITAFAPILYTVIGGIELISPTTDPILLYLVFAIIMLWTQLIDDNETDVMPYALLCVLTAFLVSVKLSVGVLVLLAIEPAVRLIRARRIKETVICLLAGLILDLPYFIRNVIISGWVIYPFPALDLFDVAWKLPAESARHDADEITTWARYVRDASKIDQSVTEWAPVWWNGQTLIERFLSGAAILAFIAGIVWCVTALGRLIRLRKNGPDLRLQGMLFTELMIMLGSLFWFFTAPLIRYGYLYLLLVPLMTVAVIINDNASGKAIRLVTPILFICILLYPIGSLAWQDAEYIHHNWSRKYAFRQQDYPKAETGQRDFGKVTFYYPIDPGTPVWYDAFPSVLYEDNFEHMEYIGNSIPEGFRTKEE